MLLLCWDHRSAVRCRRSLPTQQDWVCCREPAWPGWAGLGLGITYPQEGKSPIRLAL